MMYSFRTALIQDLPPSLHVHKITYANGILFVPNYHVKLCWGEVCLNVNYCDLFSNKSWDLISLTQMSFPRASLESPQQIALSSTGIFAV